MKFLLAFLLLTSTAFGDITVTGEGSAKLTPDLAQVRVAIYTEAVTPTVALGENNLAAERMLKSLAKFGVAAKDLQTSNLSLRGVYGMAPGNILTGYGVENQVTVTVRRLPDLGKILGALVTDGANRFNGLQFGSSNSALAYDEARIAAVRDAEHKATLLAAAFKVRLDSAVSIDEGSSYAAGYESRVMAAAPGGMSVPTAAGQLTITVHLNVRYAINSVLWAAPTPAPTPRPLPQPIHHIPGPREIHRIP